MIDILTVMVENKEYYVVDKVNVNEKEYYCLIGVEDNKNFLIRRIEKENDKTYLNGLDNEEEFNSVLEKYIENLKNKKIPE